MPDHSGLHDGMDVERIEQVAEQLGAEAHRLEEVATRCRAQRVVLQENWAGADAAFLDDLQEKLERWAEEVRRRVEELGRKAKENAKQQKETSGL